MKSRGKGQGRKGGERTKLRAPCDLARMRAARRDMSSWVETSGRSAAPLREMMLRSKSTLAVNSEKTDVVA